MKRFVTLFALVASCTLAGCKDVPASASTTSSFVRPAPDVVIKSVRVVATGDAVAGANGQEYYVVKFSFTNDLGYAFIPRIDHFAIQNIDNIRFLGAESGSTALVGISNYAETLKPGDSHEYTVGFRVPQDTYGTLIYDPTTE